MSETTTREKRAVELLRRLYQMDLTKQNIPDEMLREITDFFDPPDYGEPVCLTVDGDIVNRGRWIVLVDWNFKRRCVACVNACRGIRDPEREIAALREAADAAKAK